MSDLISRSELIKHFEAIQQQENAVGIDFVAMIDEIKEQPTAYDVDDVCEWELKNVCYTTSIKHYYSLPTSIVKTFNNCPYCGKKIKVVEVEHGKMNLDEYGNLEEPCLSCDKAYMEILSYEWYCDEKECPYTAEGE